jgi:endonuclease/exonuclease/phosphatase family metal-dependent hydrolase
LLGDFNCQPGSRFYNVLADPIAENSLVLSDMSLLAAVDNVFTCSDSGANTSWINHVICSHLMNSYISDMVILYDYICFDDHDLF